MSEPAPLTGMAIGETLALPFDGCTPKASRILQWAGEFPENREWGQATKMATLLARNLVSDGTFNPVTVLADYVDWYRGGDHKNLMGTLTGAFDKVLWGIHWNASGLDHVSDCGAALRSAPIGLFFRGDYTTVADMAAFDAKLTHKGPEAVGASVAMALGVAFLAEGFEKNNIIDGITNLMPECEFQKTLYKLRAADTAPPTMWSPSPKVEQAVLAAFQCFLQTSGFIEAVSMATKLGISCSFTAAMTGALAGAYYGTEQLKDYVHEIEEGLNIKHLDHMLCVSAPKLDPLKA